MIPNISQSVEGTYGVYRMTDCMLPRILAHQFAYTRRTFIQERHTNSMLIGE